MDEVKRESAREPEQRGEPGLLPSHAPQNQQDGNECTRPPAAIGKRERQDERTTERRENRGEPRQGLGLDAL